jgi:hypothetical protein
MSHRIGAVALALVVLTGACTSPQRPDDWEVQRIDEPDRADRSTTTEDAVCADVRALALGSTPVDTDLAPLVEELARLAAVAGATAALPSLNRIAEVAADPALTEAGVRIATHDLLVTASRPIDEATYAACEIPLFTALYAATDFADCRMELEIPVAAYTAPPDPTGCATAERPDFLPCFSADEAYLPVDCVSDEIVTAAGTRWSPAGAPREVVLDRTDPEAPEEDRPDVVAPEPTRACRSVLALFRGPEMPNGPTPDVDRLTRAVADLDPEIRGLVDRFVAAISSTPDLAEFEALVTELDRRTAADCGLPLVSAWASVTTPESDPVCWVETGLDYPAYERVDCEPPDPSD